MNSGRTYSLRSLLAAAEAGQEEGRPKWRSILKLQVSGERRAAAELDEQSRCLFDLMGAIRMAQAIRLHRRGTSLVAQWKMPLRAVRHLGTVFAEARAHRYFALLPGCVAGSKSWQLACLPGRWHVDGVGWSEVSVTCVSVHATVHVAEATATAMLTALQQDDRDALEALVPAALEGLRQRTKNPYAATLGGYVLVRAQDMAEPPFLAKSLLELAADARSLPDALIMHGSLMLRGLDDESAGVADIDKDALLTRGVAWRSLKDAIHRGPPLLRFGLTLLADCLAMLRADARWLEICREDVEEATRLVTSMCARVDPAQAFCVFDVAGLEDLPLVVDPVTL